MGVAVTSRGDYHFTHAARADLCRRLGRTADARLSYGRALALTARNRSHGFSSVN